MTAATRLTAPFPYFGGKRRVADVVWRAFGDVELYVEPFAGSLAVLLGRPAEHTRKWELVNDADLFLVNFWRAVQAEPEAVAEATKGLSSETEVMARSIWLVGPGKRRLERMWGDPEFYDVKAAGWWLWIQNMSIGGMGGYQLGQKGHHSRWTAGVDGRLRRAKRGEAGVVRWRQQLTVKHGILGKDAGEVEEWARQLAERLAQVQMLSGDWKRALKPAVTNGRASVGVFLDPPYSKALRSDYLYAEDGAGDLGKAARAWALGHGKRFRIALCGLDWEHRAFMPDDWQVHEWKSGAGGWGKQGGARLRRYECVWFSPACDNIGTDSP